MVFPNGTVQHQHTNGDITIEFPDGQRELHTKQFKVIAEIVASNTINISIITSPMIQYWQY